MCYIFNGTVKKAYHQKKLTLVLVFIVQKWKFWIVWWGQTTVTFNLNKKKKVSETLNKHEKYNYLK